MRCLPGDCLGHLDRHVIYSRKFSDSSLTFRNEGYLTLIGCHELTLAGIGCSFELVERRAMTGLRSRRDGACLGVAWWRFGAPSGREFEQIPFVKET